MANLAKIWEEELDTVLKKIKSRKGAGLVKILPEVLKTRIFDDMLLRLLKLLRFIMLFFSIVYDLN